MTWSPTPRASGRGGRSKLALGRHESSMDAPNAVFLKRGLQLPSGLPEAVDTKRGN